MRRPLVLLPCLLLAGCVHRCPEIKECRPEIKECQPETKTALRAGFRGLVNPLLDIESNIEFKELRPFKYKVFELIEERKHSKKTDHVSVYFRDLNNGPVFGFDETEKFSPASLLKVPLMMAVLKHAESDPAQLSRRLVNDIPDIAIAAIDPGTLERGKEYSVDELLYAMIADSDNHAMVLLRNLLSTEEFEDVYTDLGMLVPDVRTIADNMSVREYASFFRILYNASYLNRKMSQRGLELLTASRFKQGIVAGVPPGISVAHKFGERGYSDKDTKQLHDCGIVYFPQNPYVLCIMTRGTSFSDLTSILKDISQLVYSEVASQPRR